MQKKTIKWAKKLLLHNKGKEKKRATERDRKRFTNKVKRLACAHAWKTKEPFNYVRLVGKYAFFDAKIIFSHCFSHAH